MVNEITGCGVVAYNRRTDNEIYYNIFNSLATDLDGCLATQTHYSWYYCLLQYLQCSANTHLFAT